MKRLAYFAVLLLLIQFVSGCGDIKGERQLLAVSANKALAQKKVKLFIGQDLKSIRDYVRSGRYPAPAGVTSYLSFYNVLSASFPAYGGLGLDSRGYPTNTSVDWGAGPLNALALAKEYPKAVLNIGLNIAEGNQSTVWVSGGLKAISEGKFNQEIYRLATFFKSVNNPILLRIGYEFDGVWNKGYENTQEYINAYRHIVDTLRAKQVSNVAFVWQASASPIDDIIESKHEDIRAWYPGDSYVDWMGLSWFLPPNKVVKSAATQEQLSDEVIQFARIKRKPVIIAEASPQGYDIDALTQANLSPLWDGKSGTNSKQINENQVWNEWFVPFFTFIRDNADVVKAVSYINADWDSQALWSMPYPNGYWGDTRVQGNSEISKQWLLEISDKSFWLHGK